MRRLGFLALWCLLSVGLEACPDGSTCINTPSRCEGTTLVECQQPPNNPGHIVRTPCAVACVAPANDLAFCAESALTCSPTSFQPYCVNRAGEQGVVVCQTRSNGEAYPILGGVTDCAGSSTTRYDCTGTSLSSQLCTEGNTCQPLTLNVGVYGYCGVDSFSCSLTDPPQCGADRASVRCVLDAPSQTNVHVRYPANSPEARADCP